VALAIAPTLVQLMTPCGTELVRTNDDYLDDGEQIFVKVSYLFRL
jgi:hypothetical protein